jgi:hypothetical protein
MSIFSMFTRAGDNLRQTPTIRLVNDTGARLNNGEIVAYKPSTGRAVAVTSTAITQQYPLLVCTDSAGVAIGATGNFCAKGLVKAKVADSLAVDLQVMPTTTTTGGTTLIQFATDTKAAKKSCGFTVAIGAGATPTDVLFDGESGRTGGYSEAS